MKPIAIVSNNPTAIQYKVQSMALGNARITAHLNKEKVDLTFFVYRHNAVVLISEEQLQLPELSSHTFTHSEAICLRPERIDRDLLLVNEYGVVLSSGEKASKALMYSQSRLARPLTFGSFKAGKYRVHLQVPASPDTFKILAIRETYRLMPADEKILRIDDDYNAEEVGKCDPNPIPAFMAFCRTDVQRETFMQSVAADHNPLMLKTRVSVKQDGDMLVAFQGEMLEDWAVEDVVPKRTYPLDSNVRILRCMLVRPQYADEKYEHVRYAMYGTKGSEQTPDRVRYPFLYDNLILLVQNTSRNRVYTGYINATFLGEEE